MGIDLRPEEFGPEICSILPVRFTRANERVKPTDRYYAFTVCMHIKDRCLHAPACVHRYGLTSEGLLITSGVRKDG